MNQNKDAIRGLYAAIIRQAINDWKRACRRKDAYEQREIQRFFKSEWGQHILETLNIDFKIINDKYNIINPEQEKEVV